MKQDDFTKLLKTYLPEMEIGEADGGHSVVAKFKQSDEFSIKITDDCRIVVPYDLTYEYNNMMGEYCIRSINKHGAITDGWTEDVWLVNPTVDELKEHFIRIHKKYITLLSEIKKVKFEGDFE